MRLKTGDIIGVSGRDLVSDVINVGTFGVPGVGISHVGMVMSENGGNPLVYESTSAVRPACYLQKRQVKGMQCHQWDLYRSFAGPKIWVYPLRRKLYHDESVRLERLLNQSLGTPYDLIGAIRSGGFLFRSIEAFLHPEDTSALSCSEAMADFLTKIGIMRTRHVGTWSPNHLCRYLVRHGICAKPQRVK